MGEGQFALRGWNLSVTRLDDEAYAGSALSSVSSQQEAELVEFLVRLGRAAAAELIDRTSVRVMPTGTVDLTEVAARLANRAPNRAEATVQSDLRLLLLAAGLNLREDHLEDVVLEAPVGKRRRIDVEVGATVFEVKRDLRVGNVRVEAVDQLAGYVRDRVAQVGARYVGVLTDGVEWHCTTSTATSSPRCPATPCPAPPGWTGWCCG